MAIGALTSMSGVLDLGNLTRKDDRVCSLGEEDTLVLAENDVCAFSDEESDRFDLDRRLCQVGGFGRYQRRLVVVAGVMFGGTSVW